MNGGLRAQQSNIQNKLGGFRAGFDPAFSIPALKTAIRAVMH
jgi:hypothetical protein